MSALTITVERDTARPRLEVLRALITSKEAKQAIGTGVRRDIRTYLRALPANKQGFPSTGFYKTAAESVTAPEIEGDKITISITQIGMRQRYLGGPIKPRDGKTYLTIPAQGVAYGQLAPEISGLKFAFVRNDAGYLCPALIADDQGASVSKPRRKKGVRKAPIPAGEVLYWLIRGAMQQPDPTVLPTGQEMATAGASALQSLIRARLHDPTAMVHLDRDEEGLA